MLLNLILGFAVSLRAEETTRLSYLRYQQGQAPTASVERASTLRADLATASRGVREAWAAQAEPGRCDDFGRMLTTATNQFDETLALLPAAIAPYPRARLKIMVPLMLAMETLFAGHEAGFDEMNGRPVESCVRDRVPVTRALSAYTEILKRVEREILGVDGFDNYAQIEDELLTLAGPLEMERDQKNINIAVGWTVASLVFWEFAQARAAKMIFGTVPAILTNPWVLTGIRGTVGLGELIGFNAFNAKVNPDAAELIPTETPNFAENSRALADVLRSPMESPELYAMFMSGLQNVLVNQNATWLNAHRFELAAEWPTIVSQAIDTQNSFGLTLKTTVTQTQEALRSRYGLDLTCASGLTRYLLDTYCLRATRRVLAAFETRRLPKLSEEAGSLFHVVITDHAGFVANDHRAELALDYTGTTDEMAEALTRALRSPALHSLVLRAEGAGDVIKDLTQRLNVTVTADASLSPIRRWQGLMNAGRTLLQNPGLLPRAGEILNVGRTFRPLHEEHFQLREDVAFGASDEELTRFFSRGIDYSLVGEFKAARERFADVQTQFAKTWGWAVDCNTAGALVIAQCLVTLDRLDKTLKRHPNLSTSPGRVMVVDTYDLPQEFAEQRASQQPLILLVRREFRELPFIDFALQRGWLYLKPAN